MLRGIGVTYGMPSSSTVCSKIRPPPTPGVPMLDARSITPNGFNCLTASASARSPVSAALADVLPVGSRVDDVAPRHRCDIRDALVELRLLENPAAAASGGADAPREVDHTQRLQLFDGERVGALLGFARTGRHRAARRRAR